MSADIVIKSNGVFSGIEKTPFKGGVAIEGNRIAAVGDDNLIDSYIGTNTRIFEYGDCLVMPGLVEGHGHFPLGAYTSSKYFLSGLESTTCEEEAVERLKEFADKNPDMERLVGQGWFPINWDNAPLPTKHSLDAVVPDRPVYLNAADGHTVWMNSKALEEAKIPKEDDAPFAEFIDKDENGELTGTIHDDAGLEYTWVLTTGIPDDIGYETQSELLKKVTAKGITMWNDLSGVGEGVRYEPLERIENEGKLKVRVNISDGLNLKCDYSRAKELAKRFHSPFLQLHCIKGAFDGVTSTYTGFLQKPYADKPETCGSTAHTYEEYRDAILAANKEGLSVRLHCIGDGAVHWALDIYEESTKVNDCSEIRNCVEHIESIDWNDVPRFAQLNVVASMQPAHLPLDANEQKIRLGEERWKTGWVFKSLLEADAILAFGTDFSVVDFDPFPNIYYAVTRNGYDHKPTGNNPEQKISLYDTLRAYTWGGAYSCHREHEVGTLEQGKLADVIVLDRNLFTIDVEDIPDTKVLLTMVDGEVVYQDP